MRAFTDEVYKYNTRHNKEPEAHKTNLTDLGYRIHEASKQDDALRRFQQEYKKKISDAETVKVYEDCRRLGYVEYMDGDMDKRVQGLIVLVTPKGQDFVQRSRIVGISIEWMEHYYKILTILGAFLGGVLANIIIEVLK
jgi:hypothetical protein